VQRNFAASLSVLEGIGTLEEVQLPDFPYREVASIITGAEAYAAFDDFIAAGRTTELTARKAHGHRLAGAVLPAHDYIRAQRIRRIIAARFNELASRYDALLAPTLGVVASRVDRDFEYMLPGASGRPLNYAGVLAGSPTISIFNGLGRDNLPTAIQFAGARLEENAILDAATALEQRTEWRHKRPDVEALMGVETRPFSGGSDNGGAGRRRDGLP
jgi:aspartyl-tRNA(Asn)/glutamyl-tRNA(Gln) amidotransferase subunit A